MDKLKDTTQSHITIGQALNVSLEMTKLTLTLRAKDPNATTEAEDFERLKTLTFERVPEILEAILALKAAHVEPFAGIQKTRIEEAKGDLRIVAQSKEGKTLLFD